MIYTGIDIVYIPRIKEIIEKEKNNLKENKFIKRVFHPEELEHIIIRKDPFPGIAGRFAAKEAAIKAMSGIKKILNFKDIKVIGKIPRLEIKDFPELNVSISISHDNDYAISIANIIENV